MTTRAQFIAGVVDQQTGKGDPVGAMLIGHDALPDAGSEDIRQRVLRLDMSAVKCARRRVAKLAVGLGRTDRPPGTHTDRVWAVAFSPDGTRVLTGSADNTARLWGAATGEAVAILAEHTGQVTAIAFSPDGTRILTGSEDNTARLWDAATGKVVTLLAGHAYAVRPSRSRPMARAFSPAAWTIPRDCGLCSSPPRT